MESAKNYFLSIFSAIIILSSCAKAQETEIKTSLKDKKVLIVYLSRTKNTKTIAEIIQKNVGGDLAELELQNLYPENYKATVEQVSKENATGFLPPLKTLIKNIEMYDVVFIGFPTWGMKLPSPMKSFLKQYDLTGKTIIPFNTNAGYGVGSSFDTLRKLITNTDFVTKTIASLKLFLT